MAKEDFNITSIVNSDGCFDLQFRKDTRHDRINSPTYYRWKAQFVVTEPKSKIKVLQKIKKEFECGEITISKDQARLSVQKINDIAQIIVPFFRKKPLKDNKKKDFEMWAKAVEILLKNKGKAMADWKKNELHSLIEIQKVCAKYKERPKKSKWLEIAHMMAKSK